MNWNLPIANDYGELLDDIKKLSAKSRLLLEKRPAYQFDLSLLRLENVFSSRYETSHRWTAFFVISRKHWSL